MLNKKDLLEEFNDEVPGTRKMLERVPFDKPDFKPSPKSMSLEDLMIVLSSMPFWFVDIINEDSLELDGYKMPPKPKDIKELLKNFDEGVKKAQEAFSKMDDKTMNDPWALKMKGKVLMESPRGKTIQQNINHMVHHRAQLGVYLKMNGIPHPSVYGASGDEGWK